MSDESSLSTVTTLIIAALPAVSAWVDLRIKLAVARTQIENQQKQIEKNEGAASELHGRIDESTKLQAQLQAEFSAMGATLASIDGDLTDVKRSVDALASHILNRSSNDEHRSNRHDSQF
jgi:chromosome segregation ATPase